MVQLLTPILVPLKFLFWSFLCFGLAGFLTGLQSGNATYQMSLTRPASGGGREKTHTNCIWQHPVSVCEERIGNQNSTDEWWTVWKVGGGGWWRVFELFRIQLLSFLEGLGMWGFWRQYEKRCFDSVESRLKLIMNENVPIISHFYYSSANWEFPAVWFKTGPYERSIYMQVYLVIVVVFTDILVRFKTF